MCGCWHKLNLIVQVVSQLVSLTVCMAAAAAAVSNVNRNEMHSVTSAKENRLKY